MAGGVRSKSPPPVERPDLSEGETLGDVRAVSHSKGACHRRHFRLRGGWKTGASIFLVLYVVGGISGEISSLHVGRRLAFCF